LNTRDFDSVVVLSDFGEPNERALTRAQAVLKTLEQLGGIWKLSAAAKIIPAPVREALYRSIAKRRYRIFGKYETCPVPQPQDQHKFLSDTGTPIDPERAMRD
jgi:predicted DCC family thiol-disulfide oxidoreductase YuxK